MKAVSLSRKLTALNLIVSGVALTLASVAFAAYDLITLRDSLVRQLSVDAQIVGANSAAALSYEIDDAPSRNLNSLQAAPDVLAAEIYLPSGTLFAAYAPRDPGETLQRIQLGEREVERHVFSARSVTLARRIYRDGEYVGTIHIHASLRAMYSRLARYATIATAVLFVSMVIALLTTRSVQRAVSTPLVELAGIARRVAEEEDYAVRAVQRSDDSLELRLVMDAFNEMLAGIQARNRLLKQAHDELEARVQQRTAELEAINQELESFTYSVSHDLRAPIRHIMGFATMLGERAGSSLDERSRKHLTTITDAAGRMGRLIDDLLAFSRMGRTSISPRDIDLSRLVHEARLELGPDIAGRDIEWQIQPLPVVHADPALLRPVMVNLLSNAVKYSRNRTPARIEVGSDVRSREATVFVRDNGVGFDMRYINKLFGVFQRLHRADEFEGTGIGLANVRRIITRHGGRTWAEGEVDRGATFYVTLPLARESRDAGAGEAAQTVAGATV